MSTTPATDKEATFRPNDDGMTDFVTADFARRIELALIEKQIEADTMRKHHANAEVIISRLQGAIKKAVERFEKIRWGYDGPCGANAIIDELEESLSNASDHGHLPAKKGAE